jgi:hypothetical protein
VRWGTSAVTESWPVQPSATSTTCPEGVLGGAAAAVLVRGRRLACVIRPPPSRAAGCREDAPPNPGAGTAQPTQARAPQPERALEVANAGLDADPPVAQPSEPSSPLQRQPRLARRAGALLPNRLTPSASTAWSLAAVPNPRLPTTVAGTRSVTAATRWTDGTGCGASGGLRVDPVVGDEPALVLA